MAYKVDKFNGAFLTSVSDGTVDSTTDLRFVGKNYAGYGEIQNENFLHLMENFANTTPPPKAIIGQIWYDTTNQKLRFYNGSGFKLVNGAETGNTQPSGLGIGEFWWNTTTKQLYVWSGTQFDLIGPETSPDLGDSATESRIVKDSLDNDRVIVEIKVAGKVIAIVSREEFDIQQNESTPPGFVKIKKGITLIESNIGITSDDHRFWGTASDSDRLGGVPKSQFDNLLQGKFDQEVKFVSDKGFKLGNISTDQYDFYVKSEIVGTFPTGFKRVVFERTSNDNPTQDSLVIRMNPGSPTPTRDVAEFRIDGIFPGVDSVFDLGSSTKRWNSISASAITAGTFNGNLAGNSVGIHVGELRATNITGSIIVDPTITAEYTGIIGNSDGKTLIQGIHVGTFVGDIAGDSNNSATVGGFSPAISATPSTLALRDTSGGISATTFTGTATQANTLKLGVNYVSAATTNTVNTIVARDVNGDIFARLFNGTATAARYADLAEKYLSDKPYQIGTVVSVGGSKEITESKLGDRAIGIVSENPAFMMNKDLEGGIYIALKGRVPCRVKGAIKKGQRLMAYDNGCAIVAEYYHDTFAIAMENNDDMEEKIIEVVVL
jgi:hypothetical protein